MARKNTEAQKREILERLLEGKLETTIQDELGLSTADFDLAMQEILESHSSKLSNQPVEHAYAEFALDMTAIMRQLSLKAADASPRDSVAALKAMADIRHTLLKEARSMGVVRVANGGDGAGTVNAWMTYVSNLSSEEIRANVLSMLQEFKSIDSSLVAGGKLDAKQALYSGDSIWDESVDGTKTTT